MNLPPSSQALKHMSGSPLSRMVLLAYVVLIVYASGYPFTGWELDTNVALKDMLTQWPHYWTGFDVVVNILGYIPLGCLLVFSLYPWVPRFLAMLIAGIIGSSLSIGIEIVQFSLPSRVTSLLDIVTNSAGAFLGAIVGALIVRLILENKILSHLSKQWLRPESSKELVLLGLWPLAHIFPQAYLFGLGHIFSRISTWSYEWFNIELNLSDVFRDEVELNADQYLITETLISACAMTGAILLLISILNRQAPRFWISLLFLCCAFAIKSLATAILIHPDAAFAWITPGALGGLFISSLMLYGFSLAPLSAQRRLAMVLIGISLLLINFIPNNPYFALSLQGFMRGKMLNFYGAAEFLAITWPFLALWISFSRTSK
jgi:VanZ family protein